MALKSDGFSNSSQLEDRRGDKPLHLAATRGDYAVILPMFGKVDLTRQIQRPKLIAAVECSNNVRKEVCQDIWKFPKSGG